MKLMRTDFNLGRLTLRRGDIFSHISHLTMAQWVFKLSIRIESFSCYELL